MKSSKSKAKSHREAAQDYGIDLSLLESNLRMSPTDRIDAHQKALELALLLRQAGENARSEKNPTKTPGK